ncbi:MAG: helix-turn-helix domain-containing protein, partial [Bacteroidales bacterium]|nr:helix-turn-helix domain-containing protein [Bacteroidales bacterium]
MAKECGITRMTLDNILAGKDTKVSDIESLARALGVDVGYLFHDDDTSLTQRGQQNNVNGDTNIGQTADTPAPV